MRIKADWVVTRTQGTRGVAQRIKDGSGWEWGEKNLAGFDLSLSTEETLENQLIGGQKSLTKARAGTDETLDEVHDMTAQFLAMARYHFRDDAEAMSMLEALDTEGDARREILADAQRAMVVWQKLPDQTWNPTLTNTLETFTALFTLATTKVGALEGLQADVRGTRTKYHNHVAQMWADCVAWYEAACLLFPEGSPEGDMIRGIQTNPPAAPSTGTGGGGTPPPGV